MPVLVLWGAAALAYFLYRQAFPGGFLYDDAISLEGLESVTDISTALFYVMNGETGPLGRPLSLASFLVNAPSWPLSPADFHYFNVLLHIINAYLLGWLALLLARALPNKIERAEWFAVAVAVIWLLHPAWAFLVLHTVQRMAILATTFVLLGLIAYLKARSLITQRPALSMSLMACSLAVGTAMAALAKENGVLLPLFAATLEWLIRTTNNSHTTSVQAPIFNTLWRYWNIALFWVPGAALAIYLSQHWPGFDTGSPLREFTGGQRLMSEARALWQYIFNLLLPRPANFSPFFDDYVVSKDLVTPISTLVAALGLAIVVIASWMLRFRFPILFFGIAWFLVGHSIESSVVQLEIYFEHRNYLPSIGLIILLVYGLWNLPKDLRRLCLPAVGAFSFLLAIVLWQLTTLWGQPAIAATVLADRHPQSVRTIQFLADQYGTRGLVIEATSLVWQAHLNRPDDTGLAIQGVELFCPVSGPEAFDGFVKGILPRLSDGHFSHLASTSLTKMFRQLLDGTCPSLRDDHLQQIIDALMANPRFQASPRTMATLHYLKGRLYIRAGDFNSTLVHLIESSRLDPNIDLTLEIAKVFASGGLYDEAYKTLDAAARNNFRNPVVEEHWRQQTQKLREQILKMETDAATE